MRTKMKMNVTVAEMEAEGWEVTVKHLRRMFNFTHLVDNTALRHLEDKTQINPKGGLTFILLEKEVDGGSIRLYGEARCRAGARDDAGRWL